MVEYNLFFKPRRDGDLNQERKSRVKTAICNTFFVANKKKKLTIFNDAIIHSKMSN